MIQEMERAIAKREQIAVRYKGKIEAAAGRSTKARRGMLASGNGAAGSGLGDLTTTALKKKVSSSNNSTARNSWLCIGGAVGVSLVPRALVLVCVCVRLCVICSCAQHVPTKPRSTGFPCESAPKCGRDRLLLLRFLSAPRHWRVGLRLISVLPPPEIISARKAPHTTD